MRLAVINLTAGGISGGYRNYLLNIIPRLAAFQEIEAILFAAPPSLNVQSWFGRLENVRFVDTKASGFSYRNAFFELNQHLETFAPDVVFVPVERYFRFNNLPVVNMIQNMEPFVKTIKGNPLIERVKLKIKCIEGKKAARASQRIIAISRFVMNFLSTRWEIPEYKIRLIYHGLDAGPAEEGEKPRLIPQSWSGRFLFTAGSIRPARGLEDLLRTMSHLELRGPAAIKLVIAGSSGSRASAYHKRLLNWVRTLNLSSNILWVGQLNSREMKWCYQNCKAFIMTSRVESFGITGGEAMAHGCTCIAAENPCLPEIFDDAAIYYPPEDTEKLAYIIQKVLDWDEFQVASVSEKARKRAAFFSWDICARKTVEELTKATDT
jgi:glycosyltransferase involved in cell wall biosynthesis